MSQGIFGIIDFNNPIENPSNQASVMGRFLQQVGSRAAEISYECSDHYILGMKRICEAPYQQTAIAHDNVSKLFCLMHGEIHNFHALLKRHSNEAAHCEGDIDLSLHLYHHYGPQFARQMNGLFSLAILDHKNNSLILLNDRFGMAHQVYWITIKNKLCFATHLKTLLAYPEIRKKIDPEALNLFLKYSYIPSPWTIFKEIKKLPPGNMLVFNNESVTVKPYWEFEIQSNSPTDLHQASQIYTQILKESISKRMDTNNKVGILLSGGLDSSANVGLAAQNTDKKLKTFSIGFENPAFDERPYARIIAQHFNTEHFEYTINGKELDHLPNLIWHMEEPYFEFGLFLTYLGMAAAKKEVDVVIGGEGADQLFGTGGFAGGLPVALRYILLKYHLLGPARIVSKLLKGSYFYNHDNLAFKLRLLLNRVVDLNDWYFYGYDAHELSYLYTDTTLASLPQIFPDEQKTKLSSFETLYWETQINQDIKHYINENVMVKSGRVADMLDISLRESYLDTDVVDFLVSLDHPFKRSGSLIDHLRGNIKTKFLHRKAMEGLLPQEIMKKPKQGGFVPVMIFLDDPDLRRRIYNHLLNSEAIREYFTIDNLNTLFSDYERILGKTIYWHNFYNSKANRILFLLTFDIWHHFYMKNHVLDIEPLPLSEYLLP